MPKIEPQDWPKGVEPAAWGLEEDAKRYMLGECQIIVGTMPSGKKHLSISHPDRHPTWDEMKQARYELLPDNIDMAMYLPASKEYVNIHNHCFHWYQCTCYSGG